MRARTDLGPVRSGDCRPYKTRPDAFVDSERTEAHYPLTAPTFPGVPYQVAAGSACVRPVPGKATVHTETILATPTYTQVEGDKCTKHGIDGACFTVRWEHKYRIDQDWDIFFW